MSIKAADRGVPPMAPLESPAEGSEQKNSPHLPGKTPEVGNCFYQNGRETLANP